MNDKQKGVPDKWAGWREERGIIAFILAVAGLLATVVASIVLFPYAGKVLMPIMLLVWAITTPSLVLLVVKVGRKWRTISRAQRVVAVAVALTLIASPAIATLLLTQTTPTVTAAAILSTSCTSGATPLTANVSFYLVGVTSYIRFTCTLDSHGYETKGGIVSTPTFTLPSGPSQLWSYESSTAAGGVCSAGTGAWQMTSGSAHTFPSAVKDWDYCMVIPNTATVDIAQYTVGWSA